MAERSAYPALVDREILERICAYNATRFAGPHHLGRPELILRPSLTRDIATVSLCLLFHKEGRVEVLQDIDFSTSEDPLGDLRARVWEVEDKYLNKHMSGETDR